MTFTDASSALPNVEDGTQEVEICDLDNDGTPEVLFGNGDIVSWTSESNRLLVYDPTVTQQKPYGEFKDLDELGFNFSSLEDLTEDIECANLDGDADNTIDAVVVGNTGMRNWLFMRMR